MRIRKQGRVSRRRVSALRSIWCVFVLSALTTGRQTAADTVSFADGITNAFVSNYSGTRDTMVVNTPDWEDTNIGGRTSVQVGTGYAGGASAQRRRLLLRFDNLSVMAGQYASIDSANVVWKKLSVSGGGSSADVDMFPISFLNANAGWIEGTGNFTPALPGEATWNNLAHPATPWAGSPGLEGPGDIFNPNSPVDTVNMAFYDPIDTEYEFDVTPGLVETWITGSFPNAGLLFKQNEDQIPAVHELYSSEYVGANAVNLRPRLVIDYTPLSGSASVPEPTTLILLLVLAAAWAVGRPRGDRPC